VAEAAAVPVIGDIGGRAVEAYVSLRPGLSPSREMEDKVTRVIETEIGRIARPGNVWIVADMPKTRSGKIMRRVIAAVSSFADAGDVTTLASPEIVEDIRQPVQSAAADRSRVRGDQEVRRRVAGSGAQDRQPAWPVLPCGGDDARPGLLMAEHARDAGHLGGGQHLLGGED